MANQSFNKAGNFIPAELAISIKEFLFELRRIMDAVVPRVKDSRFFLSCELEDGTSSSFHLETFEQATNLAERDRRLRHTEIHLAGETGEIILTISCATEFWYISLNSNSQVILQKCWEFLEKQFALCDYEAGRPDQENDVRSLAATRCEIWCKPKPLNWGLLAALHSKLASKGMSVSAMSIDVTRHPTEVSYNSWEAALADVQKNGEPETYAISLRAPEGSARIRPDKIIVDSTKTPADEISQCILESLAMEKAQKSPDKPRTPRTCFVAYSFNEEGERLANTLIKFLHHLSFSVSTGRGFSPGSISAKVKQRMERQAFVFAICTAGDNPTWLVQESLLGNVTGKHLFLLKEQNYKLTPALLNDLEYIPFKSPFIETTFIPILEGLREVCPPI